MTSTTMYKEPTYESWPEVIGALGYGVMHYYDNGTPVWVLTDQSGLVRFVRSLRPEGTMSEVLAALMEFALR